MSGFFPIYKTKDFINHNNQLKSLFNKYNQNFKIIQSKVVFQSEEVVEASGDAPQVKEVIINFF